MNILITLPSYLIQAILDGKKNVEVRTKLPIKFNTDTDVVFVVEKGTHNVPLMFSIRQFVFFDNWYHALMDAKIDAAVSFKWLYEYCNKHQQICLWEIGRICEFQFPDHMAQWLDIKTNPQSFSYIDYDEDPFPIKRAFWGRRVTKEEYDFVYQPDLRKKYLNQYLEEDPEISWEVWCELKKLPQSCRGKAVQ